MKKEKSIDISKMEAEEKMKYEVAEELGLLDTILRSGWKAISSKDTGKIGGIIAGRKKSAKSQKVEDERHG